MGPTAELWSTALDTQPVEARRYASRHAPPLQTDAQRRPEFYRRVSHVWKLVTRGSAARVFFNKSGVLSPITK